MEKRKKTFFDVFKERWNRENMGNAFIFPLAKLFIAIVFALAAVLLIFESIRLFQWLAMSGEPVLFSLNGLTFYRWIHSKNEPFVVSSYLDSFSVSKIILTLPFAVFLILSLCKVHGKVYSEDDVQSTAKRIITKNRFASVSVFLVVIPVLICSTLVSLHWDGIYTSYIYGHTELVEKSVMSKWYFITALLSYIVFAVFSSAVYSIMNKVLRDDVRFDRDGVLKGFETGAKISFIALEIIIFFSFFSVLNGHDVCCFVKQLSLETVSDLVYPLIILVLVFLLDRHRSVLAKNCIAIADEREKTDGIIE